VTSTSLVRELHRVTTATKLPKRLKEIFEALGNDPFVIQETYVRQTLVERLSRRYFSRDQQIHAKARREIERLQRELADGELPPDANHRRRHLVRMVRSGLNDEASARSPGSRPVTVLSPEEYADLRARAPGRIGAIGPVEETGSAFVMRVLLDEEPESMSLASYVVPKTTWDEWWTQYRSQFHAVEVGAVASPEVAIDVRPQALSTGGCGLDDVWDNGILDDVPAPRAGHTAVWTTTRPRTRGSR